jgi:peptide/nickel transport system permease protein
MTGNVARRLLAFPIMLCLVSVAVFLFVRVIPGDIAVVIASVGGNTPTEEDIATVRTSLGLDAPLTTQYAHWISGLVRLDLGQSLWDKRPITETIAQRFPATLALALMSITISLVISLPVGILSAIRRDSWVDYLFRVTSIGGLAVPPFWSALLLLLLMVHGFRTIPPQGYTDIFANPWRSLSQLIWPALIVGYSISAVQSRLVRSTMLEILNHDFVRTARAKGLRERTVIWGHALRVAVPPVVTLVGLEIGQLLGGVVVMEQIFTIPGIGTMMLDGVIRRDYPVVQNVMLLMALVYLTVNLALDLAVGKLDPRARGV